MSTIIANENKIYVFGVNDYFQLGLDHNKSIYDPQLLMSGQNIRQILSSETYSVILENNNLHFFGELFNGNPAIDKLIFPTAGAKIRLVAAGYDHILVLMTNDDVFGYGWNSYGQMSLHSSEKHSGVTPILIPKLLMSGEKISKIVCGHATTFIVKKNTDIMVVGSNDCGQLGLGHDNKIDTPQLLMTGQKIRQIVCGFYHTIILKADGTVLSFGNNRFGQLGLGHNENQYAPQLVSSLSNVSQIASGDDHVLVLKENNDVLVFGRNDYGQLGLGYACNQPQPSPKLLMSGDERIYQISCGEKHSLILKENGDVLLFGYHGSSSSFQYISTPKLLPIKATQLMNTVLVPLNKWKPSKHHLFSPTFRQRIVTFLLIHKLYHNRNTMIYLPKFVRFEIIKLCVWT